MDEVLLPLCFTSALNQHKTKCCIIGDCVLGDYNLLRIHTFKAYTAAYHQGAIKMLQPHRV